MVSSRSLIMTQPTLTDNTTLTVPDQPCPRSKESVKKKAAHLHLVLLQTVDVQQVGGGLGVVGQLRLSELRAERLQGLGRGLHHQSEGLDRLPEEGEEGEREEKEEERTRQRNNQDKHRAEPTPLWY